MCLPVHRGGGSTWAGTPRTVTPSGRYTPLGRCTSLGRYPLAGTPPSRSSACWEILATSGWYASYWNAFLLCWQFTHSFLSTSSGISNFGESLIPIKMWFHKNPLIVKILSFQIILSRDCYFSHKGNHMKESTIAA